MPTNTSFMCKLQSPFNTHLQNTRYLSNMDICIPRAKPLIPKKGGMLYYGNNSLITRDLVVE